MSHALEISAIVGVAIAIWVLYLYRKGRLKEDHTILWLSVSVAIVLISLWDGLLAKFNWLIGAENPTHVILASFIAFLLIVSIYFSVKVSLLTKQNERFVQELAILKMRLSNALKAHRSEEKDAS